MAWAGNLSRFLLPKYSIIVVFTMSCWWLYVCCVEWQLTTAVLCWSFSLRLCVYSHLQQLICYTQCGWVHGQKLHLMTLCVHADSCCTFGAIQGDEAPHPWKTHLPKLQRMPAHKGEGFHCFATYEKSVLTSCVRGTLEVEIVLAHVAYNHK